MKAYEIKAGIGVIAGKTVCDPCLSALSVRYSGTTKRALYKYKHLPYRLAVWLSGNALASINVVALRQTQLVLGWVTVCGRVNHLGM